MRPFKDLRKTLFAFPCFLEGYVRVHVCVRACVCRYVWVCECTVYVHGTLSGRTVFPRQGAEEEVVSLTSLSTHFLTATSPPPREETQS